ncbi:MAG: hypothetical protein PVH43_14630 [Desulfobacterales bacterium]|jgi:hypothetical protein
MREIFKDILNTDGVGGVMLFAANGDVLFKEFSTTVKTAPEHRDWRFLIESLEGMRETDLIFAKGRIYIRKTEMGYLFVLMALYVPIAMIRLNCDILLPSLQPSKPGRKFGRFFKNK